MQKSLSDLPDNQLNTILAELKSTDNLWQPTPKQKEALESEADELFYGGAAGGGKTDLLLGAAMLNHTKSIIFRREYRELGGIIERANEMYKSYGTYNKNDTMWSFDCGKIITFGAARYEEDKKKYQGRAHDLKCFDEITEFSESMFRFLCIWCRTSDKKQRTRIIVTGNPPTDAYGEWVIRYWAPWLDPNHPNPAKQGEIRWFVTIDNIDEEVASGEEVRINGQLVKPKSRTFIASKVEDNPYLVKDGYVARLQALPEPFRSKFLNGDFTATEMRGENQIIPAEWVTRAQNRWNAKRKELENENCKDKKITSVGIDVARGGSDRTVITFSYNKCFFDTQISRPGFATPTGDAIVNLVRPYVKPYSDTPIFIDVAGIGVDACECLRKEGYIVYGVNANHKSYYHDRSGEIGFINKRAEMWWKLREALDPTSNDDVYLPIDDELKRELVTPKWMQATNGKLRVESKDDIKRRIGKSTDKADSLLLAFCVVYDSMSTVKAYYTDMFNR